MLHYIAFAFNPDMERVLPFMLENLISPETRAEFFYRNGFEIDFVLTDNDKLTAIEVKKTEKDEAGQEIHRKVQGGKLKRP